MVGATPENTSDLAPEIQTGCLVCNNVVSECHKRAGPISWTEQKNNGENRCGGDQPKHGVRI
jgi:hypothetical protein